MKFTWKSNSSDEAVHCLLSFPQHCHHWAATAAGALHLICIFDYRGWSTAKTVKDGHEQWPLILVYLCCVTWSDNLPRTTYSSREWHEDNDLHTIIVSPITVSSNQTRSALVSTCPLLDSISANWQAPFFISYRKQVDNCWRAQQA